MQDCSLVTQGSACSTHLADIYTLYQSYPQWNGSAPWKQSWCQQHTTTRDLIRASVWESKFGQKMKMRKGAGKDYWVSQSRYFSSEEGVDLLIRGGQEKHQIHFCSFNAAAIPPFFVQRVIKWPNINRKIHKRIKFTTIEWLSLKKDLWSHQSNQHNHHAHHMSLCAASTRLLNTSRIVMLQVPWTAAYNA